MKIEAVIGANYGDEGKGLFTEYLCRSRPSPLVVLSNGGCQRGHTVDNIELKIRHIFNHFGSGTLLGVPSVYPKTFLLNPIRFVQETLELKDVSIHPTAFRVPGCSLQLPGDMFTNQALEKSRGNCRHGSCGWGIWETKVRNNYSKLSFEQFASFDYNKKKTTYLECLDWQIENRLKDINIVDFTDELNCIRNENFIKHFIQDFEQMEKDAKLLETDNLLEVDWAKHNIDAKTLVVECGQGLLLDKKYAPADENNRTDIHTTPSKCGMEGVVEAVGDGIDNAYVVANYISRTYFTRHGAGPFPEFTENFAFPDKTNMPNNYQGSLRFGKMTEKHVDALKSRIAIDAAYADKYNIVMTHCNEAEVNDAVKDDVAFISSSEDSKDICGRNI